MRRQHATARAQDSAVLGRHADPSSGTDLIGATRDDARGHPGPHSKPRPGSHGYIEWAGKCRRCSHSDALAEVTTPRRNGDGVRMRGLVRDRYHASMLEWRAAHTRGKPAAVILGIRRKLGGILGTNIAANGGRKCQRRSQLRNRAAGPGAMPLASLVARPSERHTPAR